MRPPTAKCPSLLLLLAFLAVACRPSPPPLIASLPPTPNRNFSAEGAWQHLVALSAIGPRVPGSEGAAQARRYIAAELSALGLEADEQTFLIDVVEDEPPLALTNLSVTIPGASQDLFVLAAPYDTLDFESPPLLGVDDGASGPALLLELARVLSVAPLAYSTRLLFLEGEKKTLVGHMEVVNFGSKAMARQFQAQGVLPRIRLLVVFNRVAGSDLRILRDPRSHRFTREAFWDAAGRLGFQDAFPRAAAFEPVEAGHESFLEAGMRPAAAIVGAAPPVTSSPEAEDIAAEDTLERCSAESLRTVGFVTLQTLETQSQRLARIDRAAGVPTPAVVPTSAEESSTISPSVAETTPSDAPQDAADAPSPQAQEVEPPAAEVETQAGEVEPHEWEMEPESPTAPEQDAAAATTATVAPATHPPDAPSDATPLCANDGLSRCPRAPRAAGMEPPAPSAPEDGSAATGVEAEAPTP
jgi:hypothetical protein